LTSRFVADSSMAIAWVVPSQSSPASQRLHEEIESGSRFLVPQLWFFEVANTLLTLARRRKITVREHSTARHYLNQLGAMVDEEGCPLALGPIVDIADRYSLSVYDATYLELSLRRHLPLASRDAALNRAAKAAGIVTLS
jgi:predicted nucleic acid-binding protein